MIFHLYSILRTAIKLITGRGSFRSWSQFGEDAVVHNSFRYKNDGVYVDVGSYHPHLYSNTYAMYRRGWKGIVIDPNPSLPLLFKIFRPRDTFINVGVGVGERSYKTFADGAYNTFAPGSGMKLRRLDSILKEQGVTKIDFLTIDVEGMDLEVLNTHDWSVRPEVVAVESDFSVEHVLQNPVYQYLRERGYDLQGVAGKTLIFEYKK